MAKIDKSKKPESEDYPDAWSRFEKAVDVVAKAPPQHRAATPEKASPEGALSAKSKKPKTRRHEEKP